jgi:hypothetical protein
MAVQISVHRIECFVKYDSLTVMVALQDEQYKFEQNLVDRLQVMLV